MRPSKAFNAHAMPTNLNALQPDTDGDCGTAPNQDNSDAAAGIEVYFRDLAPRLISHIQAADTVVGCVAWLTHPGILQALCGRDVAIVVQKEDFLRPDIDAMAFWKAELRRRYDALRCRYLRYDFGNMIGSLSLGGDPTIQPVRCVGNFNRERHPAFPRMHNKFLVFCKRQARGEGFDAHEAPVPYAVWTGSFNLTANATQSLENALYITEPTIVNAYFKEFGQIMALSEPLDWTEDWTAPEWRIGS